MEYGFSIFILIFGGCVFLYGLYIMLRKDPYLPYRIQPSLPKRASYHVYLGKIVMLVSCSFLLTGVVSLFLSNPFLIGGIAIGSFVGFLILGIKGIHE